MKITAPRDLQAWHKKLTEAQKRITRRVVVCQGPGCLARGSDKISAEFEKQIKAKKIKGLTVESLKKTGCHGLCEKSPLVAIEPDGILYTKVKIKDVAKIIEKTIASNEVIDDLLYVDPKTDEKITKYQDIPFYKNQKRIALRNLGKINSPSLEDYVAEGGYQAVAKVLTKLTPEDVIKEVVDSNLRGRGGGGFPTGRKWKSCRAVESEPRYVICNGDEGDPGAFMDRAIMEGDPHSVLEGMMIAAYAVGAKDGYIYVREEYPLAVINVQKAIEQLEEVGLLGDNILGTDFSLRLHVSRGAGAFVCGESSALMRSVGGDIGEPNAKYIRSVVRGLYGQPTVLNNVETYANVPVVMEMGGKEYAKIGSPPKNTGTKAFSLVGKVRNTGLIEVPMGTTLREIIFDIGGGIIDDRPFKAVQTGGPSGGCLPESKLDLPVDFDSLTEAGSMMGSGGMIVMDDKTCMVDVARYFLSFLVKESCGKCVPCREGLYQLFEMVSAIAQGKGKPGDIEKMEQLSKVVLTASLCGLGKSGPNPLLSTLEHFRDEYEAHINDKKCPAGVCRDLITYEITDACTGCMACISACAQNAITGRKKQVHTLDKDKCDRCGACVAVCTYDAIAVF